MQIANRSKVFAGRLALFTDNWQIICLDPRILNAIQGYQIEWLNQPHQVSAPLSHHFSKEESESLNVEIQYMLTKGAISPVVNHQEGFLSSIFLTPKKDGGHRPIINLNKLNNFFPHHYFKMEGIHNYVK